MHWVTDRLKGIQDWSTDDVKPGEGKIITLKGEKVGVYKNEAGDVTVVNATCPHLACIVNWNSAEKSWDCPCHGGRFTCEGKVIQGPAVKDLEQKSV